MILFTSECFSPKNWYFWGPPAARCDKSTETYEPETQHRRDNISPLYLAVRIQCSRSKDISEKALA